MKARTHGFLAGAALFVAFALVGYAVVETLRPGPPLTFHSATALETHAPPGGRIRIRLHRTAHYVCDSATVHERWFSETEGYRVPSDPSRAARPLSGKMWPGTKTFTIETYVPTHLTPGPWCYQPSIQYHCDPDFTVSQPPACLIVDG